MRGHLSDIDLQQVYQYYILVAVSEQFRCKGFATITSLE